MNHFYVALEYDMETFLQMAQYSIYFVMKFILKAVCSLKVRSFQGKAVLQIPFTWVS